MVEIKSKNYSTPLNLSSAAGHVKDLSFAQGWPTHFRDALIQFAAQIKVLTDESPGQMYQRHFQCSAWQSAALHEYRRETFWVQPLCRDDATVKGNCLHLRGWCSPMETVFCHLLDGNLGCQASLCFPFSSKWLTHRDGNMTLILWWDHWFFLITDTCRNVKRA